ncbi:hypothetical protein [Streptomyces sp. NPDC054804]
MADAVGELVPGGVHFEVRRFLPDGAEELAAGLLVEPDAGLFEQHREPEHGHGEEEEAEEGDGVVGGAVLADRAEHAEDDRHHEGEQHGGGDQGDGDPEAGEQVVPDVQVGLYGRALIAVQDAGDSVPVAFHGGLVGVDVPGERGHGGLAGRRLPGDGEVGHRVAGVDDDQEEDEPETIRTGTETRMRRTV